MIKNMTSNRSGRPVANQFVYTGPFSCKELGTLGDCEVFQSYDSIIVVMHDGKTYLDSNHWDYSRTTSKYRNDFLNETKKETLAKINSGEYKLVNLND